MAFTARKATTAMIRTMKITANTGFATKY